MGSPVESRKITFTNKQELQTLTPLARQKIESLPIDIPFTITENYRSKDEYDHLKEKGYEVSKDYHDHGNSIDVRTDEQGHAFISWLQGPGIEWAKQNVKKIMRHGDKGGTDHYHIEFK